jgi:hypothetical protein
MHGISDYKQTYSDFGQERNSLVGVHLEQIKALMLPNQVSKVLMWLFQQDDAFYADDNKTSLWNVLRENLNLTAEQTAKIMGVREHFRGRRGVLQKSLGMVVELHNQLKKDFSSRIGLMQNFETFLDTTQEAKFLVWVENNKACVHLLNTMWMDVEGTTVQDTSTDTVPAPVDGSSGPSSLSSSSTPMSGGAGASTDGAMSSAIASAMATAGALASAKANANASPSGGGKAEQVRPEKMRRVE